MHSSLNWWHGFAVAATTLSNSLPWRVTSLSLQVFKCHFQTELFVVCYPWHSIPVQWGARLVQSCRQRLLPPIFHLYSPYTVMLIISATTTLSVTAHLLLLLLCTSSLKYRLTTRNRSFFKLKFVPVLIWSAKRPGVDITICGLSAKALPSSTISIQTDHKKVKLLECTEKLFTLKQSNISNSTATK